MSNSDSRQGPVTLKPVARTSKELAIAGWSSKLTAFVVGGLVIEILTGLWVLCTPFSITAQLQLILHTLAGIILILPYAVHQWGHVATWYNQKASVDMVLGYASLVATTVCMVSGVAVTVQTALGTRLHPTWDLIHMVSGVLTGAVVTIHVGLVYARRREQTRKSPELAAAIGQLGRRVLGYTGAGVGAVCLGMLLAPVAPTRFAPPEDYSLPTYAQNFEEYRGNVFAPTYARTESGMFVEPAALSGSTNCGTSNCHEQILAEWQPSAHRFSAMNPPFKMVQRDFAEDREPQETRYCAGCHDPISLFAGAENLHLMGDDAPGMQEGTSCAVCHSISSVDARGNADYVLTAPSKYLWEDEDGLGKILSDFLIRAYPHQHLADYDRNVLRTPEFCGACHKQFIPEALNRFGMSPGQNQYDAWRKSHWHSEHESEDLSCRDCHMRLVYDSRDPGHGEDADRRRTSDDGAHRHHGLVATNSFMSEVLKLPHWEEQVRLTKEWVAGETVLPEIADLWPEGPVASLDIDAPTSAVAGEDITLHVGVANRKVGHNFTAGPLDFIRVWVHMTIHDGAGNLVAEWGQLDPTTRRICDSAGKPHEPGNSRNSGTLVLEGQPLDENGEFLMEHELWRMAGGMGKRVIFPNHSDRHSYTFTVPSDAEGPLRVHADLNLRRYRQDFLDRVVPDMERDSGVYQPTLRQAQAKCEIGLLSGTPSPGGR